MESNWAEVGQACQGTYLSLVSCLPLPRLRCVSSRKQSIWTSCSAVNAECSQALVSMFRTLSREPSQPPVQPLRQADFEPTCLHGCRMFSEYLATTLVYSFWTCTLVASAAQITRHSIQQPSPKFGESQRRGTYAYHSLLLLKQ